jgi:hypothetical protein
MFSNEYAMHQETYVGNAPLFSAKTRALFRAEREDEVVKGECVVTFSINRTQHINAA